MKNQRGMTFFGFVFLMATLFFYGMFAMKLLPAYFEYQEVKKAIERVGNEPKFSIMTNAEVQSAFSRSISMDGITAIDPTDLKITRTSRGQLVVTADYLKLIPLFGNMSMFMQFTASTDKDAYLAMKEEAHKAQAGNSQGSEQTKIFSVINEIERTRSACMQSVEDSTPSE